MCFFTGAACKSSARDSFLISKTYTDSGEGGFANSAYDILKMT